ncbi:MAG: type VI secretion system Vgr family protein [Isosphaeraceae bacterium]
MSSITQSERTLAITTPLGVDVLLLLGFTGTESLSRLFSYQLELASTHDTISAKQIVGKAVSWSISRLDQAPRYFSGIVSKFVAGAVNNRQHRTYRAEVVPWPWLLTRTTDCRIFQNQNTPEIIESIFKDFGFSDFALELKGAFPKREYCVQYRETAFNFISRLMEHEGIFFFFRHGNGKHTMVLSNAVSSYTDCPESPVEYSTGSLAPNHIHSWEHYYEFRSGKWSRTDYNFETPSTNLLTTTTTVIDLPDAPKYEIFDYPGEYVIKGDGDPVTKVRMEEEEAGYDVVSGAGQCCTFTPSGKFTLQGHEVAAENGDYVITSIRHAASELSYGSTTEGASYSNLFTCIPASVIYRPPRATPKPMVQGIQTAVVTGPSGEEIYVDKYGRVKVQFFWDRKGKKNESSSCWIRVSEQWAGKNWGFVCNPRIGQEVIVDFLEGDPDRPLITGRVYNAEQMPPYDLPGNMTQSGIKSRSSKGGSPANCNEILFEDKKGSELVSIHAEKDQSISVEHDESHTVGHDRTKTIDHDETSHIKHDRTETVDNNETITIHGNRTETVDKDEKITIHGNRTEVVDKDETITIHGNRTETVDKNENITISGGRTENVSKDESITIGGGRTENVSKDESITIGGGRTENVSKDESITIGGGRTESVSKDESITISGGRTVSVSKDEGITISGAQSINVTKSISITAGESITLTVGKASIVMNKDGTITIDGKDITTTGSGEITQTASKNMTLKGQKILQN